MKVVQKSIALLLVLVMLSSLQTVASSDIKNEDKKTKILQA